MLSLKYKKFFAGLLSAFFLLVLILPFLTYAADPPGLVKCGTYGADGKTINKMCDFNDLIGLINDIIKWIIGISGVIFTISAIYGGFLYMTSGDKPANKDKAKSILWSTLIGFVIILVAWLIVYTLLHTLVNSSGTSQTIFNFIGKN